MPGENPFLISSLRVISRWVYVDCDILSDMGTPKHGPGSRVWETGPHTKMKEDVILGGNVMTHLPEL